MKGKATDERERRAMHILLGAFDDQVRIFCRHLLKLLDLWIFVFFFVWIWFESMKNVPATVPYKVDVYSETNRRAKKWANPSTFGETTHRKWPNAHQFGKVFCGCSLLKWSVGPDMGLVWSLNIRYSIVRNSTHAHRRDEHISTSDRHDHDIFMCLKKWKKKNALWSTTKLFRVFCFFFLSLVGCLVIYGCCPARFVCAALMVLVSAIFRSKWTNKLTERRNFRADTVAVRLWCRTVGIT